MRIVLDTNVLVSALLSPAGAPARVLDLALEGELLLVLDDRMMLEYRQVLERPKFRFPAAGREALLDWLAAEAARVVAGVVQAELPDPEDVKFLEAALSGEADFLVTGNSRHFPAPSRQGVRVVSLAEFLDALGSAPPAAGAGSGR